MYIGNLNHLRDKLVFTDDVCVCQGSAHVTNVGQCRGMMSTAGLELPYPRVFQVKFSDDISRREK